MKIHQSKIEKLISELCPNGVKLFKLSEIAKITIGEFVHKNRQNPNGEYPVFNGGISETGFYDEFNNAGNKIIVSARGANAGYVNKFFKPYWAGNSCYTIDIIEKNKINWIFVYYYLKNNQNKLLGEQQKGGIPAVSKKQMENIKIPIPPLVIQEEIVKILNSFTELEAELEAELEVRKKQYEHYRSKLLTFSGDIRFKKLGEVIDYVRGVTYGKSEETSSCDGWKILRSNNISLSSNTLNFDDVKIISKTARVRDSQKLKSGDILISAASGSKAHVGKVAYIKDDIDYYFGGFMAVIRTNELLNSRFLFHLLIGNQFSRYLENNLTSTTINNLSSSIVNAFEIPVPPLEEQKRIVITLDKFDALVNNISIGLPAELKVRRQQYEYYRGKLLAFNNLTTTSNNKTK